jgi:uncharacterized membrane protein YqjE
LAPEPDQDHKLGDSVQDVADRMSLLVREEIELAKAEVEVKVKNLARGAAIGAAAGIFVVVGLLFLLDAGAWGLADIFNNAELGFLLMAIILFILGALAGLGASKLVKKGAPPKPELAIEEAKLIKQTVSSSSSSTEVTR